MKNIYMTVYLEMWKKCLHSSDKWVSNSYFPTKYGELVEINIFHIDTTLLSLMCHSERIIFGSQSINNTTLSDILLKI